MEVGPVSADRWSHLVDLFDRRGPRGGLAMPASAGCACRRSDAMHELVAGGTVCF